MINSVSFVRAVPLLLLAAGMNGCGNDISGVYSGEDTGFLDQMEFLDDNKVELMFMGTIREGTYEVRDGKVRINNGGEITVLTIDDDGCLQGGGILGSYCRGGGKSSAESSSSSSKKSDKSGVIGHTFAAGPAGAEITVEFLNKDSVRVGADGEYEQLRYVTRGDEITIRGNEGQEMTLVPRGNDLEGGPDGMVMLFRRR